MQHEERNKFPPIACGRDFGKAVCDHLGLPVNRALAVEVETGLDNVMAVKVTLAIGAEDLQAIAERMKEMT